MFKQQGKPLILAGDGRADSPGHSAKYGSYTVIDLTCNKVVDFKLVQVGLCATVSIIILCTYYFWQSNEVGGSFHMEKEGLHRAMSFLKECGMTIGVIVTDPHKQINKWLREITLILFTTTILGMLQKVYILSAC